nr:hypothetical protein Iba_scaffold32184CG0010 [Ipomoea batatas]GMD76909.1 hypothetical protein Iba_chr13bCG14760 [Ipomoea batatas]
MSPPSALVGFSDDEQQSAADQWSLTAVIFSPVISSSRRRTSGLKDESWSAEEVKKNWNPKCVLLCGFEVFVFFA